VNDDRVRPPPVEVEAKFQIHSELDFQRVQDHAGSLVSTREQLNCYLDTAERDLVRLGWSVRIRFTEDQAILTWKHRTASGIRADDAVFRAVELERALDRTVAMRCLTAVVRDERIVPEQALWIDPGPPCAQEVRERARSRRLVVTGWSHTRRSTYRVPGRPDLILDETRFPDGTRDFEVEVECEDPQQARERALDAARAAGIRLTAQTRTKHERALGHPGNEAMQFPGGDCGDSSREPPAPSLGVCAGVGVAVFLGYLAFLPPILYWLDAPEIAAAGFQLAQTHPPGHPAMIMGLKAFLMVPIAEVGFRANLCSAVFAALAAALVCRLAMQGMRRAAGRPDARAAAFAGVVAGISFGVSFSAVIQALSVEVYAPNVAFVLGALSLAMDAAGDARRIGPASLLLALGLGNHHFLTLLAIPAVVVAAGRRTLARPAFRAGLALGSIATVFLVGYLWVRGLAGAWPAWADTSSPDGIAWVVSARLFAASLGGYEQALSGPLDNAIKAAALIASVLSPVAPVLAAGGLYVLVRTGRTRVALALLLLIAGSLASKVSMGILDPDNPDDHGYFLAAVAGVAVLQAVFAATLGTMKARSRPVRAALQGLGALLLCAAAVSPAPGGWREASRRATFRDPESVTRMVFEQQPARAVLFLSHYPVFFQSLYARLVEGVRPDLTVVQSSMYQKARGGSFYARRIAREDPDLGSLVHAYLRRGVLDAREIESLASRRPVRFDAEEVPVMPGLRFEGFTLQVLPGARGLVFPQQPRHPRTALAAVEEHLSGLRSCVRGWPDRMDLETRRVYLRHLATMASTFRAFGQPEAALRLVSAALELNPRDRLLRRMEAELAAGPRER